MNRERDRLSELFEASKRVCKCCGKVFYVMNAQDYTYKIKTTQEVWWYCRYNCWMPAVRQQQKTTAKNRKNIGRKKTNGRSQNV